jgi:hypothetical protein
VSADDLLSERYSNRSQNTTSLVGAFIHHIAVAGVVRMLKESGAGYIVRDPMEGETLPVASGFPTAHFGKRPPLELVHHPVLLEKPMPVLYCARGYFQFPDSLRTRYDM